MPAEYEGVLGARDRDDAEQEWWEKPEFESDSPSTTQPRRSSRLRLARLRSFFWPRSHATPPDKLRPTAYLDGLRGFAAFLVYWHHNELWAHAATSQYGIFESAFGYSQNYHFAAFPGVRNFFSGGHFAVATFFVISGYVLSTKPMSLIHAGEQQKLSENLASALFRRWLRLYIPIIGTTFIYMCTWHAFGGLWIENTKPQGSFGEELWSWYAELKKFSFIFNFGGEPWLTYNVHLWSIPIEMKGSIIVYTVLLALSKATRNARLWCEAGLIFYFTCIVDGWYGALFIVGMMLCDLDQLAAKDNLPDFFARLRPAKTIIAYHLFFIAIYLGGVPSLTTKLEDLRAQPGWYYASFLKPQAFYDYKWFFLSIASSCLVASIPRIPWLKRFFETRFCQYLGRISFALYLVHGPVLSILGDRLYAAVGWVKQSELDNLPGWVNKMPLTKAGPLGLEVGFLVPHLILLPVTLWVAQLATKMFDEPAVKFGQYLYKKILGGPAK